MTDGTGIRALSSSENVPSTLMLNESASAGQMLLGAALAVAVPWFSERFRPERPRLKRWDVVVRLGLVVLRDIIMSNIGILIAMWRL